MDGLGDGELEEEQDLPCLVLCLVLSLAFLFWLSCPGCLVLTVLVFLSCSVLTVLSWLSYSGCLALSFPVLS